MSSRWTVVWSVYDEKLFGPNNTISNLKIVIMQSGLQKKWKNVIIGLYVYGVNF